MHPIKMTPAYRHGLDTPWGGIALREVFGKPIPDETTGESLEVSALPGLCSRDAQGRGLDELLREGGPAMRGTEVGETFPLLLKLIHARERLSVQVHPDDAYAAAHEDGKLGKNEAWVILDAQPGARIVYGIAPGVTREELAFAAIAAEGGDGGALERCLRWLPVAAGDAVYIPAGMVHAIGEGVLLYEIQQSSDLTYRFWDWGRRDARGNGRALHLRQALDVADPGLFLRPCEGERVRRTGGFATRLIDSPHFMLDRLEATGSMPLEATPKRFRLITGLCEGWMTYPGGALAFKPGDSLFIPAGADRIKLECVGTLLLAAPSPFHR
jgi:mannose-6-phosphate isomerase